MKTKTKVSLEKFDEPLELSRNYSGQPRLDEPNNRDLLLPVGFGTTTQEHRRSLTDCMNRGQPRFPSPPYDGTSKSILQPTLDVPRTEESESFLPKSAIEEFDGDPLDYWACVNRFKVHIADRITSDDLKLVYLLQHCSKRVYDRIKHYAGEPDKHQYYQMVSSELYGRYGQPHIVGRHCEQRLLELPKVGQYDPEGIENMVILMKRRLALLEEFSGSSTVNAVGFIATIAEKLPLELRRK